MSNDKSSLNNEGFKDFIESEKEKVKPKARKEDAPVDLMPFIESEMDRINKVAKLFTKLKQHQIYPHLDGIIKSQKKNNLILEKKLFDRMKQEDSAVLKNLEYMARDLF